MDTTGDQEIKKTSQVIFFLVGLPEIKFKVNILFKIRLGFAAVTTSKKRKNIFIS